MKLMMTGSGGREHALAWRAVRSPLVDGVFVAPGNAGTADETGMTNVDIDVMDFAGLADFAKKEEIELTIVGPEAPLVGGIVDFFQERGLRCFGPNRNAAQLEGSKNFTKEFLTRHKIPTAAYGCFDDVQGASEFIDKMLPPIVVKADGIAAGKGVVIAHSKEEAARTAAAMLSGASFGDAGRRIVIEEFLTGEEASFIVMVDGEDFVEFASSQDHKAAFDGDHGPNTGGMGAYSPAPVVTEVIRRRIVEEVIRPTVAGMLAEGNRYVGFLYAGLMIATDGTPNVIEYNCRFGDPEGQAIMMRVRSDLVALCQLAIDGKLAGEEIEFDDRTALTVVMAAGGYPDSYDKGDVISGLPGERGAGEKVFHAGTRQRGSEVITNGGRVLGVTGLGTSVSQAQTKAYEIASRISWKGVQYRKDIGYRAVERELAERQSENGTTD